MTGADYVIYSHRQFYQRGGSNPGQNSIVQNPTVQNRTKSHNMKKWRKLNNNILYQFVNIIIVLKIIDMTRVHILSRIVCICVKSVYFL